MVESKKRHAQDHSYRDPGKIMGCNDPGKQYRVQRPGNEIGIKFFLPITGRNFVFFFIPIPEISNSVIRNLDFENPESEFREFSEFPEFYFCIFFGPLIQISFIFTKIFPRTVVLKGESEFMKNSWINSLYYTKMNTLFLRKCTATVSGNFPLGSRPISAKSRVT